MRTVHASLCTLEPQVAAHAREMFRVLSDAAIYEFENEPPASEAWLVERYAALERRVSKDGSQTWLNWVVRLPTGELAGYVQASVLPSGAAIVAYELASRFWRQGLGSNAVSAMLQELQSLYGVHLFAAVLKAANYRSLALLRRLGFQPATPAQLAEFGAEPDELVMVKSAAPAEDASAPYQSFSSILVRALVAYSVYEHGYEGGTATAIRLTLHRRECTLEDNGRGIGLHRDGYVTGLVEQLAVRRGAVALHGLGLALVAMSSPSMAIESRRDGRRYSQNFSWGVAQGGVRAEPWHGPSGTRITFTLHDAAPGIDIDEVTAQVQLWRSHHPELDIEVTQVESYAG